MTLVKSDGVGFRILGPQDLPQVFEGSSSSDSGIEPIDTNNSPDSNSQHSSPSDDPLLEFLERRKKNRELYERRYSRKAIGLKAYDEQKEYKPLFDELPEFQFKKAG
ncbi:MAG: hypothetical protein RJB66_1229 [Pseudomonadota bacterium]